jgi:glycerol uptake facilitator-like aquaporin
VTTTGRPAAADRVPDETEHAGHARSAGLALDSVPPIVRRLTAELTGTAFLVAGVVGSGIMAQRLTDDRGLQLLQNAAATAGVLVALILALGPASGAHFNPAVTLVDRVFGGIDTPTAIGYVIAQVVGAILGAIAANVMFDLPAVEWSTTARSGGNLWFAEAIATLGLLVVIFGVVRSGRSTVAAFAVAGYIAGAYYFTSSTSFANPAVTIGRAFSDTFAGIEPASVPMFIVAQLTGAGLATGLILVIYPRVAQVAGDVIVPHGDDESANGAEGGGSAG